MSIFSCAFWPSVCLLWRNVYLNLLPVLLIGLFLDIELHALFVYFGDESLAGCLLCRYFSHSLGCLFILFMVSFVVQKLSLIMPNLSIFVFIFLTLGGGS